jgi:hypothetical protein
MREGETQALFSEEAASVLNEMEVDVVSVNALSPGAYDFIRLGRQCSHNLGRPNKSVSLPAGNPGIDFGNA